jgi:hypothetical protein
MTFLQPLVLFGLPLMLAPVIIHLLNRMRHRPEPWAAMRFLVSASRNSVSHARLRQFLVLLCRVLAVAMLVLFIARPLAGGWLGWALSPAPDAILILLDRSASMETKAGATTKRQQAIQLLAQAAKEFEETSHLVLIDSATRAPQEIARADMLNQLPLTEPTDTASDIPAMMRTAFDWLIDNRAGTAEIWLASDGQRSNWLPEDPRWKNVIAQLGGLSQRVRVRLLAMDQPFEANASISIKEMLRRPRGGKSELQFVLDLQRNRNSAAPIPVTLTLNGERSETDVTLEGQSLRWRHTIDLGTRREGGWGSFTLPADANDRDNTAYFVYGADTPLLATVVSDDPQIGRSLEFAAASRNGQPAELISPAAFANANLDGRSLLVWRAPLPVGADVDQVQTFAASGGVVLFLPPGQPDAGQFDGMGWGAVQDAENDENFRILRWDEDEGPLAKSDEHISLPLGQTIFQRRQPVVGQRDALAAFDDGVAFLVRQGLGKGEIYFCSSLPDPGWSSLGDGPVLVPMLQRMLQAGARRVQQVSSVACGELSLADQTLPWTSVDATSQKDIRTQAGVYHAGSRFLAVNRPAAEDDPELVDPDETRKLFGDLPVQMLQERHFETGQLQGEIWRLFLFAMLLFLIVEGILILPARLARSRASSPPPRKAQRPEEQPA